MAGVSVERASSGASFPDGGGDAGRLIRAHDWGATPLGPPDAWPTPLRTLVGVLLGASQPMFVAWGRARTLLYNDAYAAILADKHPGALGGDLLEVWHDIRADLAPIVERAYRGEPVHMDDIALRMNRRGYDEEAHFAFSYTPIRDEAGTVAGFFCACVEVTDRIHGERRLRDSEALQAFLLSLNDALRPLADPVAVQATAARLLARHLGLDRCGYCEVDADGAVITVHRDHRAPGMPSFVGRYRLDDFGTGVVSSLRAGRAIAVADADADARVPDGRVRRAWAAVDTVASAAVPLIKAGRLVAILFAHQREPRSWTPAEIALMEAVADRTWAAVERAGAEATLREREERLSRILDGMTEGFGLLAPDFTILDHNLEALRIVGRPRSEIVGRSHWEVYPGTEGSAIGALLKQAMTERRPVSLEHRHVRNDGRALWLDMRAYPTGDGALAVFWRDVTARRTAEEALRESEARYRTLFETIESGFCVVEVDLGAPDGRIDYRVMEANPAFFRQTGFPDAIVGRWLREAAPALEEHWFETYGRVARTGEPVRFEQGSDHLGRWFDVSAFRTGAPADRRVAILFNDITARRTAETRLRDLNETLEQQVAERTAERDRMWDISPDLMMVVDFAGHVRRVNPAWTAVLGYTAGDLVGRHVNDVVVPEDHARTVEAYELAAAGGRPRIVNRCRHEDGSIRWISWVAAPAQDMTYATGRDVTRQLAAEEQLRHAQKMEAIGQLTGGVAHDFNNLLTPIVGGLDMLVRRGVGGERERRLIDGAMQSAERARTLVQRLLAFARRQPLQPTPVDVGALVQGMAYLIDSTTGPRIRVDVETAPDLPPATADANQLEMALLNLAVNARDAMPDGGTLRIVVAEEPVAPGHPSRLETGRYVRLSVADDGTGMDEATLARAVEPFFSTKGVGKGTGLGLSMVHGLASQLGGALAIRSGPRAGTTVDLMLPVSGTPLEAGAPVPGPAPEAAAAGTVLLVDDEDLVRMSTADMLVDLGYRVVEAGSAAEALRLTREGLWPDLLVTDHLMPGVSGTDLARLLRADRPGLPVLVVTGYAEGDGIAPELSRLTKPFRKDELAARLARLAVG